MNKPILKSKTFWLQVVAIAAAMFPPVTAWLRENPVEFVSALAAVNVLVRFATKGAVSIFGDEPGSNSPENGNAGSGGPGGLPMVLAWFAAAGLLTAALPSCAPGEWPVTGSVTWRDQATGAKAGITFYPPARRVESSK